MFVVATSLACAGAGAVPAVQSLALCTLQGRTLAEKEQAAQLQGGTEGLTGEQDTGPESGKLFGAFAVLQATGQTILGVRLHSFIFLDRVPDQYISSPWYSG
jgi:hypothetical protein